MITPEEARRVAKVKSQAHSMLFLWHENTHAAETLWLCELVERLISDGLITSELSRGFARQSSPTRRP